MGALVYFSEARKALQMAASIDEVREIRDKAEALRTYIKQQGQSLEMQNYCAEIKIRAERRAGEMLREMEKNRGGQAEHESYLLHDVTGRLPKLPDLGISRMQSSRWQAVSSIPEQVFEYEIAEAKDKKQELTSASMYRLARTIAKKEKLQDVRDTISESGCVISDLTSWIDRGDKFQTVYADPPWRYGNQATRASTDNHYVTMTPEEIAALPVANLVGEQAHLHLWTTNAFLFEAKAIIEAWGFEYKSVFVWIKPQMGIGNYWRVSHEFMLLGVRGGLTFRDHSQMSWLQAERTKHSAKPERIRDIIETVSPGPYLELFARKTIPGWHVWGNEIERTLFNEECFAQEGIA